MATAGIMNLHGGRLLGAWRAAAVGLVAAACWLFGAAPVALAADARADAAAATPGTASPGSAGPGGSGGPDAGLWQDPAFQKQFLGTYGAVSELEPKLTQIEREQLEKIMTLMGTDLDAATTALTAAATPQASAVFDFTLGNVHFQKDRIEQAAACYQTAVTKFPAFRRAHK